MRKEFNCMKVEPTKGQEYDKDEIFVIKAGKKINCYQEIQDNREDTEIYPTLEKYGCLDRITLNEKDYENLYQDLTGSSFDLRDMKNKQLEANQMWENLPLEIRREFGHSKQEFLTKGKDWVNSKLNAIKAAKENAESSESSATTKAQGETNE